jgi:hypothetical protein
MTSSPSFLRVGWLSKRVIRVVKDAVDILLSGSAIAVNLAGIPVAVERGGISFSPKLYSRYIWVRAIERTAGDIALMSGVK